MCFIMYLNECVDTVTADTIQIRKKDDRLGIQIFISFKTFMIRKSSTLIDVDVSNAMNLCNLIYLSMEADWCGSNLTRSHKQL